MAHSSIRVRFAPAPTGIMHIGNIRTALFNFIFARQKKGIFVLRIEDTDPKRNFDPTAKTIISDLHWLGLSYDEGPEKSGPYAPYFQSERLPIYQEKLEYLINEGHVYRCFCSEERLNTQRDRQKALGQAPRYDRTCMRLDQKAIDEYVHNGYPFIWRFKVNHDTTITITDLARGSVSFDMQHFSDFPITRTDGTFTFMFANFVDDMVMAISYVFRGEDHLSNTAGQASLYHAFNAPLPTFWHMPIICNVDGKKLSKRDFGFSLHDLKENGYLPEAIVNYLAIIGSSFEQEIQSLDELIKNIDFNNLSTAGQIKYDVHKLNWINQQWIQSYDPYKLAKLIEPLLEEAYGTDALAQDKLILLINILRSDCTTLNDFVPALRFYVEDPEITDEDIKACVKQEYWSAIKEIVKAALSSINQPHEFVSHIKKAAADKKVPLRELFWFMRLALYGKAQGPGIAELLEMLEESKAKARLEHALKLL